MCMTTIAPTPLSDIDTAFLIYPRIILNARQMCDLELIMNGGFSPLIGFLNEADYTHVVQNMHLTNGELWPMPVVLDVSDACAYYAGDTVTLCDELTHPIATLAIESVYMPDKHEEALRVYGTADNHHPGVHHLMHSTGDWYIGGTVHQIAPIEHYDFHHHRRTPAQLKELIQNNQWRTVIGFQTRNPLHRAHTTLLERAIKEYNGTVLLHPAVGSTKPGDIDYVTRVRCYEHVCKKYLQDNTLLSLLPLAMRMAGPREALWHALIRKNYGCTHFIVGRDHAGPGNDRNGVPFYEPYAAQELVKRYQNEIGIVSIFFDEMVYVEEDQAYMQVSEVPADKTVKRLSGTEFRAMIREDRTVPEWFSFSEVVQEIKRSRGAKARGLTIFFTGLPSAGKSTLAKHLYHRLFEIQDKKISLLDGDMVRQHLSKGLGFSKEDRIENNKRIGYVASEITKHGGIAICAAIAPFESARVYNRALISVVGTYVEVYLSTPQTVCEQRDVKGLYRKATLGTIKDMTGIDSVYEVPQSPDIILNTAHASIDACVDMITAHLFENGLIDPHQK